MLKSKILGLFAIAFLAGFLFGCGSTVVGVGKDIQRWGESWNNYSVEEIVPVEKVPVEKET